MLAYLKPSSRQIGRLYVKRVFARGTVNYAGTFVSCFCCFLDRSNAVLAEKAHKQPVIDRMAVRLHCSLAAINVPFVMISFYKCSKLSHNY